METQKPIAQATPPYRPDSIDYNRVNERARQAYYREYWSSYKGRVRGMLVGVLVGGVVGAAIGAGLALMAGLAGMGFGIAVAGLAGIAAVHGAETYGTAGSAAASRAAGLAERHARVLDPVYKDNEPAALEDKLMMDGRGHHFQFPADRDKGKLFNWKSGAAGAAIGAGVGALLANSLTIGSSLLAVVGGPAGAAIAFGALGATFGIDRSNLKGVFNKVDAASWGKSKGMYSGIDMGREQFKGIENDKELAEHRLRRQSSMFSLEEEYHNKIYASAVKGLFRGLAGGAVAGAVIAGAVGLIAFGATALIAPEVVVGLTAFKAVAAFAAVGASFGMRAFSDAGREAGAESMARAIDNEFERNQELRQRGITPEAPKPVKEKFFNLKSALVMGAIGAAVGLLLPSIGVLALNAILPASAEIAAGTISALTLGASATVGGMFGAMYGVGGDSIKVLSKTTDWLYNKAYVVHNDPTAKPYVVPQELPEDMVKKAGIQHLVTPEDVSKMEERMQQRPAQSFEQKVLAQSQQPQTMQQTI